MKRAAPLLPVAAPYAIGERPGGYPLRIVGDLDGQAAWDSLGEIERVIEKRGAAPTPLQRVMGTTAKMAPPRVNPMRPAGLKGGVIARAMQDRAMQAKAGNPGMDPVDLAHAGDSALGSIRNIIRSNTAATSNDLIREYLGAQGGRFSPGANIKGETWFPKVQGPPKPQAPTTPRTPKPQELDTRAMKLLGIPLGAAGLGTAGLAMAAGSGGDSGSSGGGAASTSPATATPAAPPTPATATAVATTPPTPTTPQPPGTPPAGGLDRVKQFFGDHALPLAGGAAGAALLYALYNKFRGESDDEKRERWQNLPKLAALAEEHNIPPLVAAFLDSCSRYEMSEAQLYSHVKRACDLAPDVAAEFEKAAAEGVSAPAPGGGGAKPFRAA